MTVCVVTGREAEEEELDITIVAVTSFVEVTVTIDMLPEPEELGMVVFGLDEVVVGFSPMMVYCMPLIVTVLVY